MAYMQSDPASPPVAQASEPLATKTIREITLED
jgi:hypothetical protein